MATTAADAQLCIDTIRTLAIDAIQQSNSGHPGLPLAMAPAAYVLFAEVMEHNPRDPSWPDRDRFVLSAGHGSMLLYAALHLSGYDLSLDELKRFRQWGSLTPGHPERDLVHVTPGVEVTTGPLGQGFANGVGMAMAERFLRERYGDEVMDHRVYAIVSDGDLMEGVASEAASLAGELGLGRIVYLYDDNDVTLDGPAEWSFSREDRGARFEAYGWHVQHVEDVNDIDTVRAAIRAAEEGEDRPSLIDVKTIIGWPSPDQGTSEVHGKALGEENVRIVKERLGWDPDRSFHVPDGVYDAFGPERGAEAQAAWQERFESWRSAHGELAGEWDAAWSGRPARPIELPSFEVGSSLATRGAGGKVMAAFEDEVPTMVGGAADLTESTKTIFPGSQRYTRERADRNVFFGVREHGMGGAVNGMAAHGGIVRPYGSTFLQFADYMRASIRLSALMALNTAWVFTHDSVALGEDGPTHQPVEHLMALRAIPGLTVIRPADAAETAEAWHLILEDLDGPAVLALSRQNLPVLENSGTGLARGAYVLQPGDDACIVATGGEVAVAIEAREALAADGIGARVVSMPSWELFEAQDESYRDETLPPGVPTVSVEAGVSLGWSRYAQAHVAIDRFGASAPGTETLRRLGITADATADAVRGLLDR
ncbi:MAG TPA: transketolase [Solirubrobacteraceae bacterium]|nr:transketolase [Solirubrobacteraceae bacterium]